MIKKLIKDIIKGEGGFNKGEDISPESEGIPQKARVSPKRREYPPKGESISNSPPSGKEGWLKAGVVGGYTMLIITDLRIHLPPPPTGTPPSRRRRIRIAPTSRSEFLNLLFTIIHL